MNFKTIGMALLAAVMAPALVLALDPAPNPASPIQVGYVVVTPTSTNTSGLVVFETFGEMKGNTATQAGVLPAAMTTSAMVFVSTNGRLSRDLGVAIANPNPTDASVTMALYHSDGTALATATPFTVKAKMQTAEFVTQVFASQVMQLQDFTGSLTISSSIPVAIVGLRFRGENFSTIPVTNLGPESTVPVISTGVGGTGAVILPQFAAGGGWASQLILANSGTAPLTVEVDIFNQDGTPLAVTLNGSTQSKFSGLTIPPKGVTVLSKLDADGDDGF